MIIDCVNGYEFAAEIKTYFPINNGVHNNKASASGATAPICNGCDAAATITIIEYCNRFNRFSRAALSATTVALIATSATNNYFDRKGRDRFEALLLRAVNTANSNSLQDYLLHY